MEAEARYLGDAVYVDIDLGKIRLFTSDGLVILNKIYLEPEVAFQFMKWIADNTVIELPTRSKEELE